MKLYVVFCFFYTSLFASPFPAKKAEWIRNAIQTIKNKKYDRIRALSYWHESWQDENGRWNQLKIDSSYTSLFAYRNGVKGADFVTNPRIDLSQKLLPPIKGRYLAAYPNFGPLEDEVSTVKISQFEQLSRRKIAWAYFSNNWGDQVQFPFSEISKIKKAGRIPFVRIMLRNRNNPTQFGKVDLHSIVSGKLDEQIKDWAKNARDLNSPLLVEFCPEMNGDWFPWSGVKVTPELYVQAHMRLVTLMKEANATNLTWFFHLNAGSSPDSGWNNYKSYYPGDTYIDWLGLSVYGPHTNANDYQTFETVLSRAYPEITALSETKPIAILEWGIGEGSWKKHHSY